MSLAAVSLTSDWLKTQSQRRPSASNLCYSEGSEVAHMHFMALLAELITWSVEGLRPQIKKKPGASVGLFHALKNTQSHFE